MENEYDKMTNEQLAKRFKKFELRRSTNRHEEAAQITLLAGVKQELLRRNLNTNGMPFTTEELEMMRGRAERLQRAEKDNQRARGLNYIFLGGLCLFIGIGMLIVSQGRGIMYGIIIVGGSLLVRGIIELRDSKIQENE